MGRQGAPAAALAAASRHAAVPGGLGAAAGDALAAAARIA